MKAYLDLLNTILTTGVRKTSRTGIDTLSCFALNFRHDLADGLPLLTTKQVSWKNVLIELLWFLAGDTNVRTLHQHNVHFWDSWSDDVGDLGPVYGRMWVAWPGPDGCINQIDQMLDTLRKTPDSRRCVITAWNPGYVPFMKLPPCHHTFQFLVHDGRLCCQMVQRSCDAMLGIPYNIASYAFLTHLMARELKLSVGILDIKFVDCHLYYVPDDDPSAGQMINGVRKREYDHTLLAKTQLGRTPKPLPSLTIEAPDIGYKQFVDRCLYGDVPLETYFKIEGYNPHPAIKARVAV